MLFRRMLLSVVALASLVWLPVDDASAQNGAWCARRQGGTSCGFATFQQCMATVLGDGGICVENPAGGARGAGGPPGGPAGAAAAKKAAAERAERAERAREAADERRRAKQKEEVARRQRAKQKQQDAARPAAVPTRSTDTAPAAPVPAAAVSGGPSVAELDVNAVPLLNREAIRRVQTVLKQKGFDPGPLNGVATPRTQEAVRAFQARYGIEAGGTIDNQTLLALGEVGLASQPAR